MNRIEITPSKRIIVRLNGEIIRTSHPTYWGDIIDKPETFPPTEHIHDNRYYTKQETDSEISDVEESVNFESQARELADTSLERKIETESENRQLADESIADDIAQESQARELAIEELRDEMATKNNFGYYAQKEKIKDYLYSTYYNGLDYQGAYRFFKEKESPINPGACSSVRKDNFYGRNYDWKFDNTSEFIVNVGRIGTNYTSLGVASGLTELTNEFVSSNQYSELYKIVPFMMLDGINEKRVVANINVVPTDKGKNRVMPTGESEVEICALMLVRYILDHFASATEAVEYIQEHMTIYFPVGLHEYDYEVHLMVADPEKTYVVEFVDNSAVVVEKPYITNFYLNEVTFNEDGTVYTPNDVPDGHLPTSQGITEHGSGLERFNLIVNAYEDLADKDDMRSLMDELTYTKSYTEQNWLTEFVGIDGLTVDNTPEEFSPIVSEAFERYSERSRNTALTWQTVHSCVYDIENYKMYIIVQEDGEELEYQLNIIAKGDKGDTGEDGYTPQKGVDYWTTSDKAEMVAETTEAVEPYVDEAVETEATARASADNTLQAAINSEATTRQNADSTLQAAINSEATTRQNADATLQSNIEAEATLRQTADNAEIVARQQAVTALQNLIDVIEGKIPSQATSTNQLADKSFVNSSIGTNTAHYISDDGEPFTSLEDLEAYTGTVTNNDYAFVTGADEVGNMYFDRYKATVVGTSVSWAKEYRLNNSSFTAVQWAAIQSGITSGLVALINTAIQGVQVADTDLTPDSDGKVNVKLHPYSLYYSDINGIALNDAASQAITSRVYSAPITPHNLDYAVKAAMCDGVGAAWTEAEQKAARKRIGEGKYELIEEIVLEEDVREIIRTSELDGTLYNFRKVLVFWESDIYEQVNGYTYIYFSDISKNTSFAATPTIRDTNQIRKGWVEVQPSNGFPSVIGFSSVSYNSFTTAETIPPMVKNIEFFSINKIRFYTSITPFKAGTIFKIYAIRN